MSWGVGDWDFDPLPATSDSPRACLNVQVWGLHALRWTQLLEMGISEDHGLFSSSTGPPNLDQFQTWFSKEDFLTTAFLCTLRWAFERAPLILWRTVNKLPAMQEMWVRSLSQSLENPLEKEMATHSSIPPGKFCPGKCHGQRSLAGYKSWTWLSD